MRQVLFSNIGDLVTLSPLVVDQRFHDIKDSDLGRIQGAWLAVENGKVVAFGHDAAPSRFNTFEQVNAGGSLVIPGLVDSHTHPLFAGSRAEEFWRRLSGATYQEIAAAGGGIASTVNATRQATDQQLEDLCKERLTRSLALGITTQEVKSGYGLSPAEEYRHLKTIARVNASVPQTLAVTCLALHAKSPEYETLEEYVAAICAELLPKVTAEHLADWVDAFIEAGYFSVEQCEPYVAKAKALGLGIRVHADEFSDAGAAEAAARWGAGSADHLQFASDKSLAKMAEAGTVAAILPGTSLYTNIPYTDGKRFVKAGVPVAVATDYNPGSCQINNLAQVTILASLHCGLTPATAFAGCTLVAARALRLETIKGHLAVGADADLVMYRHGSLEEWFSDFGKTPPASVYIGGKAAKNTLLNEA